MNLKLETKLEELKQFSNERSTQRLIKKIYDLDLDETFLSSLSQDKLQFIHVKLHNSLSYNKPFAKKSEIKRVHDEVSKLLANHNTIDELDY